MYHGNSKKDPPDQQLFLKDNICKEILQKVPNVFDLSRVVDKTKQQDNQQVEIFDADDPDNHITTCYNPQRFRKGDVPDKNNRSRTWCATAPSYTTILDVKNVVSPDEIGIVSCK